MKDNKETDKSPGMIIMEVVSEILKGNGNDNIRKD